MSSEYSYDDQAQFFPFFILTVSALVTVPLTYTLLRPSKDDEKLAPRIQTTYKPQDGDVVAAIRSAQKRKQRRIKRTLAVIVGWALIGAMAYLIMVTQRTVPKIWNPYDILGISETANEKQIRSHYKKLSLKFHPDKARPDPAKNETLESLNDHYVDLTKAYQALTDDDVRNNYIQYGHPDGKQSFSIGIALPKFIIADGNGKYIVLLYTVLLGVLLPYLVGSWWYGTKRRSKEGVLMESANNLFRNYKETMDEGAIIAALSSGKEYDDVLRGDQAEAGLSKIESRIAAETDESQFASGFTLKDKNALEDLDSGVRRKTLALLWAYLGRVELDDQALTKAKYEVAPIARTLNQSFAAIALAYGNTGPIMGSFHANQHIIQAVPPKASPLLQLPHFTSKIAAAVEGDSKIHSTVQQFMDLPDARRRQLAVGKGLLSEDQYKEAVGVGKQLPYLRVAKAFFKVTGERIIIPSSLVTLVIKGRFIPPGTENIPAVNDLDLEDIDPAEDDLEALMGRKKQTIKGADGKPVSIEEQSILPPLTFAPHYGREQTPKWYAFLIRRAAPPQTGHYTFVMHVVCDSYVGFDTKMEVTLVVDDANKAAEMTAEDDISEPDEGKPSPTSLCVPNTKTSPQPSTMINNANKHLLTDSIAGQMQALKTGQAPPPSKSRRKVEDDSDEESGTEEEDDDTSATNTDTEDES
ncbi:translocation complex component [Paramyrothecium foliicola]|nr:translocation complex component [Paramyrothecium foliicola]